MNLTPPGLGLKTNATWTPRWSVGHLQGTIQAQNCYLSLQVVLPTKAIKNERILETLMYQANSGMYRIQESYIEECQQKLQKQDSRFSEWESFDYGI